MKELIRTAKQLTYAGALLALEAAVAKASEIGVPQNISVVDAGGNLLAFARMDGARFLAQHSSLSKAQTAASLGMNTGHLPPQFGLELALATGGRSINMVGGLPMVVDGAVIGAVGVSSGSDEEDLAVAEAACAAILGAGASSAMHNPGA
jgi:glc operon protein GlcG